MRFFILLAFVAAASASAPWQTGREYVYKYRTAVASSIPALKNQVSGVSLKSDVIVQVQSPNELIVKMDKIELFRMENQVYPWSWRQGTLKGDYQQLDSREAELLQAPFKVHLRQGQVVEIEVDSEEPKYSIDIKRGLASQLSLSLSEEQRLASREAWGNGIEKEMGSALSFDVEVEPSVSGACRTRYTIVPLPEFIARKEETDLHHELREMVQERPAYMITKSRDLDSCQQRAGFVHSGFNDENELGSNILDGQYKRFSSRSATTRYLVRGEPKESFVVLRVWAEGEHVILPFATKTESMHVLSNQTLILKEQKPFRQQLPTPRNPIRRDIEFQQGLYQQEPEMQLSQRFPENEEELEQMPELIDAEHPEYPSLTSRPAIIFGSILKREQNLPIRKIAEQIKSLVHEVKEHIIQASELEQHKPSEKINKIAEGLMLFNIEEINELYHELVPTPRPSSQEQKITKQVLVDAIALAGTNPAVTFLAQKIAKEEIRGEQASQIIMTLPMTVKTPTPELLQELVEVAKRVESQESVWGTAILAISNLIHRACVNPRSQRNNFFHRSTKFCTPNEIEIVLPYLQEKFQQTNEPTKISYIVIAIGNLGHPKALELLRPVIEGRKIEEKQVRATAIYALGRLASTTPKERVLRSIRSLLAPIFAAPQEPVEVRIAAFVSLIASRPDESFFTQAASGTWFEQSQQVGQFVYSTLENLANLTYPMHMNVSRKAALALPLAKPFRLGAHYSKNMIMTHAIPNREIASYVQLAMVSGQHSLIPETVYLRTKMFQGNFDVPVFQMALQTQGIQKLLNEMLLPTHEQGKPANVDVKTRKDYQFRSSLWTKIVGQYERIFTMESIKDLMEEGLIEMQSANSFRVNYQKALTLDDLQAVFPSESGFPVYAAVKMPTLISVRGNIKVEAESQRSQYPAAWPKNLVIKADLKPFICQTRVIETGVVVPMINKVFSAGHKMHALATLPHKFEIEADVEQKKFELILKKATDSPAKIEFVKYESTPYTAHYEMWNLKQKWEKPVHRSPLATKQMTVGQKTLGLRVEVEQQMDEPSIDLSGLYHALHPHTFLSMAQFSTVPGSLRAIKYRLGLNLQESETREARLAVQWGRKGVQWNQKPFDVELEHEKLYDQKYEQPMYNTISEKIYKSIRQPMPDCGDDCPMLQNIRDPASRRSLETQEFEEESQAESKSFHAVLSLRGSQSRKFQSTLVWTSTPSSLQQRLTVMFEKNVPRQEPFVVRAHGMIKFQPLPNNRREMLNAPKAATGHLVAKIGKPSQEEKIEATLVMDQTQQQRIAASNGPIAAECAKDESNQGPYSQACREARLQATLLNKMILSIKAEQQLPKAIRNLTYQIDDLVKYNLYPHMTQDRIDVRNPEKEIKLVVEFQPKTTVRPYTVMDFRVYKPTENTFFNTVRLSQLAQAIFPLSARESIKEKTFNRLMKQQYSPRCKVQENNINTFDNVTLNYELTDCYHLIAKDCSKQVQVQVFAKKAEGEKKQIKLNVGPIEVEILPSTEVIVDGSKIDVPQYGEKKIVSEKYESTILIVKRPFRNSVIVEAPVHGLRVASEGERFGVEMSNLYRGRTCGLCGDMNGEKVAEFKDPKNCIRRDAKSFGRSYAIDQCREQIPAPKHDQAECEMARNIPVHQSQWESPSWQPEAAPMRYITKVESQGDNVCFSVKPVPLCALGHQPTATTNVEVGFHCVRRGKAATEMALLASQGILEEMFEKEPDFSEWLAIPETCQPIVA